MNIYEAVNMETIVRTTGRAWIDWTKAANLTSVKGPKPKLLRFNYINHRGDRHEYVVQPESIEFGPYENGGRDSRLEEEDYNWVLHANTVTRDGDKREGMGTRRRTFLLGGLANLEIL